MYLYNGYIFKRNRKKKGGETVDEEKKNRSFNIILGKPPLGVMPCYVHELQRTRDLLAAIDRYVAFKKLPPKEWITELSDLTESLGKSGVLK